LDRQEAFLYKRLFEIIPAFLSWWVIITLLILAFLKPAACAIILIVYEIYWMVRTFYLTSLLAIAHHRLRREKSRNWLIDCQKASRQCDLKWPQIHHAVIFPTYKEDVGILRGSLKALLDANYPKDKMMVVMAFEERDAQAREKAQILEREFGDAFFKYLSTFHPDKVPGEARVKGANATWAAKKLKEFIDEKKIPHENITISCFDADTCVEKEYFSCLTFHYLTAADPERCSYQPIPVYNNNIWRAPSLARVIEFSSSYCQLIESMRQEKFITFSSHSMSFKTLVAVDYWPVDMISDDSVIYWRSFIYFKGDYHVKPMYITVSMDIAHGRGFLKTLGVQYRQKRRWAWGVENFVYVMNAFVKGTEIPFRIKFRRVFNLLESHVSWATWAIIITLLTPLPILAGGLLFKGTVTGFSFAGITTFLFSTTNFLILVWIVLSFSLLPPRPKEVKPINRLIMYTQWLLAPVVIMLLGSFPALDAQTRLAFGKYLHFQYTQKER
jgi:cellulose synthase/poly-beta-1,6-N-acetylglucosamine synthase-like glycosyltransferase